MSRRKNFDMEMVYTLPEAMRESDVLAKVIQRLPDQLTVTFSDDRTKIIFHQELPDDDDDSVDETLFENDWILEDFIADFAGEIAGPVEYRSGSNHRSVTLIKGNRLRNGNPGGGLDNLEDQAKSRRPQ